MQSGTAQYVSKLTPPWTSSEHWQPAFGSGYVNRGRRQLLRFRLPGWSFLLVPGGLFTLPPWPYPAGSAAAMFRASLRFWSMKAQKASSTTLPTNAGLSLALWTVGDIRLPGGALNFRGKHATLKSTFWQDAHICGDLHRIQLSSKNMFLTFFKNNLVSKSYV
jgi:hypothetical protein